MTTLAMGFPLPDELTWLMFSYLDIPSLLRCMQVCKSFHAIISGSTQFTYELELFASCMENNEHSSMDTIDRLALLRDYNRSWNNMEWTSSGLIPMSSGPCWEFSGGILAQAIDENEISLVQLPSKLKRIHEKRWSVPFEFKIRDFTFDNSQNLFVLLELVGPSNSNMTCKLHLRTLFGEHHPGTPVAQITHTLEDPHTEMSFMLQVCGNHVALLSYHDFGETSRNSFLVWDWRTGRQEVYIHIPEFRSFAFMTEDLILAIILRSNTHPTLQVLKIASYVMPVYSLEDNPFVCELQYPQLQGDVGDLLIRAEPTPTWRPPAGSEVPFYVSRKNFIFTISMYVVWREKEENTVLFVPLSTLLSEVERSHNIRRRVVSWPAWGPSGTRMICRQPSDTWVCYTYGMKFIQGPGLRWKRGHVARVYDFNPYTVRKLETGSIDSPVKWTRLAKQSKPSGRCQSFCEEVATMLPGCVATITLEHSDGGWDAAMIGEDHIVMVQPELPVPTYGYMAM